MTRKLIIAILSIGLVVVAWPFAARAETAAVTEDAGTRVINVASHGEGAERITLAFGKAAVVQLDSDARDVLVSDPSVVDAVVRTPRRIFLLGQKIGQTNAFFFDGAGHQVLSIDIRVERDVSDLVAMIRRDLPGSNVKVAALNDNIVLTGTVEGAQDAARAQDLAAQFIRDPGKAPDPTKIVNMLSIGTHDQVLLKVRVAEMERQIAKQFGINLLGNVTVGGVPLSAATANPYGLMGQALSSASGAQFGLACGAAANTLGSVASGIVGTATTGIVGTLATAASAGVGATTPTTTGPLPPVLPTQVTSPVSLSGSTSNATTSSASNGITSTTTATHNFCTAPNNAQGILNALEQTGLLHTLAEPNLTAVSGETAKFLAGGEFPVPSGRDQQGNISVVFKDFGVGLSFTPVVLSDRRISLQVSTEVSELTNTGAFTLAGGTYTNSVGQAVQVQAQTIPALEVRRAETTVELPSGGSFAIAGLLQHTTKQVLDEFPGLKEMPVLGALFRSRDFENDETELVVIISAYLAQPTTEKKLAAPTDGFVAPSDLETIALGKLNETTKSDPQGLKSAGDSKVGFIVE